MAFDRSFVRVKTMLIAPNDAFNAHAVSVHAPTIEDPEGYHRLIGGSVALGETHRAAIVREIHEELVCAVHDLTHLDTVESIFRRDGQLAHNIVFLYSERLDPMPPSSNATLIEDDGAVVPVAWRPFRDGEEPLPLYPAEARSWIGRVHEGWSSAG